MFGLQPFGEEVSPRFKADASTVKISFKKGYVSYGPYIAMNMQSSPIRIACATACWRMARL